MSPTDKQTSHHTHHIRQSGSLVRLGAARKKHPDPRQLGHSPGWVAPPNLPPPKRSLPTWRVINPTLSPPSAVGWCSSAALSRCPARLWRGAETPQGHEPFRRVRAPQRKGGLHLHPSSPRRCEGLARAQETLASLGRDDDQTSTGHIGPSGSRPSSSHNHDGSTAFTVKH